MAASLVDLIDGTSWPGTLLAYLTPQSPVKRNCMNFSASSG
jgi:hypothetical protein